MIHKLLPFVFLGMGIFLLVQVAMPVLAFKYWEFTSYNQNRTLLSPDPNAQVLGVSVKNVSNFPAIYSENRRVGEAPYKEFLVSIPSIKVEKARAVVDSNNFNENLGHLPGSPLPGEKGNVFITGHSSFPQFFRPDNYKAIFAHLPEIKRNDEITIEAGGQVFKYEVIGLRIVDPKDISVTAPPEQNGRYLTLMTCVPPGFTLKRLVVLAKLI